MVRVEAAPNGNAPRVVAEEPLDADDFHNLARALGVVPVKARKIGRVAARRAASVEHVETRWNGKETEADARPGDWIVTSLDTDGLPLRDGEGHANTYVVPSDRFDDLYASVGDDAPGTFCPKGEVLALRIEGGFEIQAPWGEVQRVADGWLLLNGAEVYGNQHETFAATYEILD